METKEEVKTNLPALIDIKSVATLAGIYTSFSERVNYAKTVYAKYKDVKYSPETKEKMDKFRDNCKKAKKECNDQRSPITREIALIVGKFTAIENELESLAKAIDAKQIAYNTEVKKEQDDAKATLDAEKKKTEIIAQFPIQVEQHNLDLMHSIKLGFVNAMVDGNKELIENPFIYTPDAWKAACRTVENKLQAEAYRAETLVVCNAKKEVTIKWFNEEFTNFKLMCFRVKDNIPALKNIGMGLGHIYQEAKAEIEEKADIASIQVHVEQVSQEATLTFNSGPKIKTKQVCLPTTKAMAVKLFAAWSTANDDVTVDDINEIISRARTWATNQANKKPETILEGQNYIEEVKK